MPKKLKYGHNMRKKLKYDKNTKNQRYSWKDQQKIDQENCKEMHYKTFFFFPRFSTSPFFRPFWSYFSSKYNQHELH